MNNPDPRINWTRDNSATVVAVINDREDQGGVPDELFGEPVYLYDAHVETALAGPPGAIIAQRHGALCRATVDGAVWIGHLSKRAPLASRTLILPTTVALHAHLESVPTVPVTISDERHQTYREIGYRETDGVAYLSFVFYRGALSTAQCERLLDVYRYACERPVRMIVLLGGLRLWSTGLHLGLIEAATDPVAETWRNLDALDTLIDAIINAVDKPTVAVLRGNASGGGSFLALAADRILAQRDLTITLPGVGGLLESGYWEYLLARRLGGGQRARPLLDQRPTLDAATAASEGLIDSLIAPGAWPDQRPDQQPPPAWLYADAAPEPMAKAKRRARQHDERQRPLADYRAAALDAIKPWIDNLDSAYHRARRKLFETE